jgi:hypothetical protein
MIAHQAISMHLPMALFAGLPQRFQKVLSVLVIQKAE